MQAAFLMRGPSGKQGFYVVLMLIRIYKTINALTVALIYPSLVRGATGFETQRSRTNQRERRDRWKNADTITAMRRNTGRKAAAEPIGGSLALR